MVHRKAKELWIKERSRMGEPDRHMRHLRMKLQSEHEGARYMYLPCLSG